jgi:hypothetical protein
MAAAVALGGILALVLILLAISACVYRNKQRKKRGETFPEDDSRVEEGGGELGNGGNGWRRGFELPFRLRRRGEA